MEEAAAFGDVPQAPGAGTGGRVRELLSPRKHRRRIFSSY